VSAGTDAVMGVLGEAAGPRTAAELAKAAGVSTNIVREVLHGLDGEGRLDTDQGTWPFGYQLRPGDGLHEAVAEFSVPHAIPGEQAAPCGHPGRDGYCDTAGCWCKREVTLLARGKDQETAP